MVIREEEAQALIGQYLSGQLSVEALNSILGSQGYTQAQIDELVANSERQASWPQQVGQAVSTIATSLAPGNRRVQEPTNQLLNQRLVEMAQREAEQREAVARAQAAWQRPEEAYAGRDVALAQQAASAQTRQEVGGTGGAGAAAVAGARNAVRAGEQVLPGAISDARQRRYSYEQQIDPRQAQVDMNLAAQNQLQQEQVSRNRAHQDWLLDALCFY